MWPKRLRTGWSCSREQVEQLVFSESHRGLENQRLKNGFCWEQTEATEINMQSGKNEKKRECASKTPCFKWSNVQIRSNAPVQ